MPVIDVPIGEPEPAIRWAVLTRTDAGRRLADQMDRGALAVEEDVSEAVAEWRAAGRPPAP